AIVGRPNDAPLFARWLHQLEAGSIAWKKSERGPWKRAELTRPWQAKGKADLLLKLADECDRGLLFTAEWLSARPYRKIEHSPQGDVKAGFVCDPFNRRR